MQDTTGLGKDIWSKIAADRSLSKKDQYSLASACRFFNRIMFDKFRKQAVYQFGVIPLGLLDDAALENPLVLKWLHDFFKSGKHLRLNLRLDYRLRWPLYAFAGLKDKLIEAVGNNPKQKDLNGLTPLDYIVKGAHVKLIPEWIQLFYPDFKPEDEPQLLDHALNCGDEEVLRVLHRKLDYVLWAGNDPQVGLAMLVKLAEAGYEAYFFGFVEALKKVGVDFNTLTGLPFVVAEKGHWHLYDEIMGDVNYAFDQEGNAKLACYAARDSHERFLKFVELCPDINFAEFNINGFNAYMFACQGGQVETVKYMREKKWDICRNLNRYYGMDEHLAAGHGQIKLLKYFETLGRDAFYRCDTDAKDIFDKIAMTGNWNNFLAVNALLDHVWRSCDGFGEVTPPRNEKDKLSYLVPAVRNGHVYFAQQFILEFGNQYLRDAESLIAEAKASGNPVILQWVEEQIAAFKLFDSQQVLTEAMQSRGNFL